VKLYADEAGARVVRAQGVLVVSALARVEVPAAIWGKRRRGELRESEAALLVADFEADWFGTADAAPRFVVIGLPASVLDAAAGLAATRGLRAVDAIQLASACAAREADGECSTFVCADRRLRAAAAAEGFDVLP
jgi:predicted nucleic acid-binding protein